MPTSKPSMLALEALALATVCTLLPGLALAPSVLEPDPGWIAVVVLAARYGSIGLLAGALASVGLAALAALATAGNPANTVASLASAGNLISCGACLLVSWIGAGHCRRVRELSDQRDALTDRVAAGDATTAALLEVVEALRLRAERTDCSLSFWRDVAMRLDGDDAVAAAEAAAELVLVRSGAAAVSVEISDGRVRRRLAARFARELADRPDTAPLALPIMVADHEVGVLTLFGVPLSARSPALLHDLELVAAWCGPAVVLAARRERVLQPIARDAS